MGDGPRRALRHAVPDPPAGTDVVLEIDVQGARQVLERCDDVVCVLLVPPSPRRPGEAAARAAATARSTSAGASSSATEEEPSRPQARRRYVVVNDDLDRAVDELAGYHRGTRRKRERRAASRRVAAG